jgi:hypothetical protein
MALRLSGVNHALREERGIEWTAGLEWQPDRKPGLALSLTYFDNSYKDRVGQGPSPLFILFEEDLWTSIIHRNPSQEDLDALCVGGPHAPSKVDCDTVQPTVIIDLRLQNIAVTQVSGLDFKIDQSLPSAYGSFDFGINGTYTFRNQYALAATTPRIDRLDVMQGPLSLRVRGTASWNYRNFGAHGALSYAPSYRQPFGGADFSTLTIGSWTTLDLGVSYRADAGTGWFANTALVFNMVNAFDEDPPFANDVFGYDAANADPYGRLMSLQVTKSW